MMRKCTLILKTVFGPMDEKNRIKGNTQMIREFALFSTTVYGTVDERQNKW